MARSQTCRRAARSSFAFGSLRVAIRCFSAICNVHERRAELVVRAAHLDRLVIALLGAAMLFVTACNQTADSASAPVDTGAATADAERLKDLRRDAEIAFSSAKFDRAAELFTELIAAR